MRARRLNLDTYHELVVMTRTDCPVCKAEGFSAHSRVEVQNGGHRLIATLYQVESDMLGPNEVGLSESAWQRLDIDEGDWLRLSHPQPVNSLSAVRGRIHGRTLDSRQLHEIIADIVAGRYADAHLAMFLTSMAARDPDDDELCAMIDAMVDAGDRLDWERDVVVDKHCVGGLPGNRTTPLVVAITTSCGLWMPKTSSRAITSPAGTADTVETMTPVALDLDALNQVVRSEGGCMAWGGAMRLSPVDDMLIRVERLMDIDAEGQMLASILSKKIAAGSTHVVLDVPVGDTAKIRSQQEAEHLAERMQAIAKRFGLTVRVLLTDGSQPVGHGIGPALEARDVLRVLRNDSRQPLDLRQRAVELSGALLELAGAAEAGVGEALAEDSLASGRAREKFEAICHAQGGFTEPPVAEYTLPLHAQHAGWVQRFDNRLLAQIAKLSGAPEAPAAGVDLHVRLGDAVARDQPLLTIHAESQGELEYARDYAEARNFIIIGDHP